MIEFDVNGIRILLDTIEFRETFSSFYQLRIESRHSLSRRIDIS